jgi:outer membrane protein insertion porin family
MTMRVLKYFHLFFLNGLWSVLRCYSVVFTLMVGLIFLAQQAQAEMIENIIVRGNGRVESDAIVSMLKMKKGDQLSDGLVKEDIKTLFELGYFSDIRFFKKVKDSGVEVIIQVAEKPAITEITYEGMTEIKSDDLKDKIETKLYTIVNEGKISADLRTIEKQYAEKGFYLSKVSYQLEKKGANEVSLKFIVEEGKVVQVGDVVINGNVYFSDEDLIKYLGSQPLTRLTSYGSASLFREEFIKNDLGALQYIYKDNGFAEVQVAKPIQVMDVDRNFVRITYKVEEGIQYNVGTIDVSGDLLFPKEDLIKAMKLKSGALFKYSQFVKDIEMLGDKYGDLGYAYADVDPKVTYDREKKLANINYEITKGEKIYFGEMILIGNTKTRDNVMRREFAIADSERYHSTNLSKTKKEISKLGFFEDVQILKNRNPDDETVLDMSYKVKEKPTGQLQASVGYTPPQGGNASGFFGQGAYEEQNQNGYGFQDFLRAKFSDDKNYSLELGFTNPRVNDSYWTAGTSLLYQQSVDEIISDVKVQEKQIGGSVFVGRKIIEEIYGRLTYQWMKVTQTTDTYLVDKFRSNGVKSSAIFSVIRNKTDNNISPTEGSQVTLRQKVTGGPVLRGDYKFYESSADASYFYPIDFTDSYRTHFRLFGNISYIYPQGSEPVPFRERYRLGGYNDMRGFDFERLGPKMYMLRSPGESPGVVVRGGDKKMFYQLEYYLPLIQEANIKALLFTDWGRVYDEKETISFSGFDKDVGFGFRWQTPIAPFRFEWAYPIVDGHMGESRMIFTIGY